MAKSYPNGFRYPYTLEGLRVAHLEGRISGLGQGISAFQDLQLHIEDPAILAVLDRIAFRLMQEKRRMSRIVAERWTIDEM